MLGIIDALSAVLRCFRGVHCLSVCFRLSERTRVFAQSLVSLTGHSQHTQRTLKGHRHVHTHRTPTGTPTRHTFIYTCQHTTHSTPLTGHLQDTHRTHLQDTHRNTSTHLEREQPLRVFIANSEKPLRFYPSVYAASKTKCIFIQKKSCNGLFGVHCRNHRKAQSRRKTNHTTHKI